MKLSRLFQTVHQIVQNQRMAGNSLQFRLTLELVALSILGLGGLSLWAGWQMRQNLVMNHKQTLEYIAMRFPEQVRLYSEMGSIEAGLERTIRRVAAPGLVVWVRRPDGSVLVYPPMTETPPLEISYVASLQTVPEKPEVFQMNDRYIVLCGGYLTISGQPLGNVYFSQDITTDQRKLNTLLGQLLGVSLVTTITLAFAFSRRIDRAMKPLEHMSQVARAISADDLRGAQLELKQAPTEILGLAQSFNDMLVRLSAAWEQQRQFVGNVSHELRTPLTVVLGYLQSVLRRSTNLNTHQQQALETATAEAERTIRMLQDLLDLARADSGNLHFRITPVTLNTLVTEVAAMSQQVSHHQIRITADKVNLVVRADQNRLQQVLINLLDNALKYSAADQPVELKIERRGQFAMIHVIDQGIGISFAHQSRIFERFYRVDEAMTRSRDGTGLGLAIAKSLVEGMNGRISVRSKPNEGSMFTVTLPVWNPDDD